MFGLFSSKEDKLFKLGEKTIANMERFLGEGQIQLDDAQIIPKHLDQRRKQLERWKRRKAGTPDYVDEVMARAGYPEDLSLRAMQDELAFGTTVASLADFLRAIQTD